MSILTTKLPNWVRDIIMPISGLAIMVVGFLILFAEIMDWNEILLAPFYVTGWGFTIYWFIIVLKIFIEMFIVAGLFSFILHLAKGTIK